MRNVILALSVFLMPQLAAAQDDSPENILSNIFTAKHECDALMPKLDAAVASNPSGVGPLLARANCYYRVGRYGWVRRDVNAVFQGRTVRDAVTQATAEGASEAEARAIVETGVVLQVFLATDEGQLNSARSAYREGQRYFGDTAAMDRARVMVTSGEGDNLKAWQRVDAMLDKHPGDPHAFMAAAEMASRDYRNITEKANALLNAPASAVGWYNEAVAAYQTGDYERCWDNVRAGLDSVAPEDHSRFYRLGYTCAVTEGSVSRSNQIIRESGDISSLRPDAVILHADVLCKTERYAAAVALLSRVQVETVEQRTDAETLQVRCLMLSGDLDGALGVASHNYAQPNTIANLALQLKDAGRTDEARAVLEPTCPRMQGADAPRCFELLEKLQP
ncbi:MAG: tetratricopeptide (TPR) repeat protein [Myxococcota bacterium]|jgi:tetratricopeptide (TPR) repeat protein